MLTFTMFPDLKKLKPLTSSLAVDSCFLVLEDSIMYFHMVPKFTGKLLRSLLSHLLEKGQ